MLVGELRWDRLSNRCMRQEKQEQPLHGPLLRTGGLESLVLKGSRWAILDWGGVLEAPFEFRQQWISRQEKLRGVGGWPQESD